MGKVLKAWTELEIELLKMFHKECTYKEIGEALGRSQHSVYAQCYKMGIKCPRPRSKYLNIYRLYVHGEEVDRGTVSELSEKHGYKKSQLYTAANRGNLYDLGMGAKHKLMLIYRDHDQV